MTLQQYLRNLALKTFKTSRPVFLLQDAGHGYIEGRVKDKYIPVLPDTPVACALQRCYSESFDRSSKRFEMNAEHMARQAAEEIQETILDFLAENLEVKKPRTSALYMHIKDKLFDNDCAEETKLIVELYNYMVTNSDDMRSSADSVHRRNVVAILYKVKEVHETEQKVNR